MHLLAHDFRLIGANVSRRRRLAAVALDALRLAGPVSPLLGKLRAFLHPLPLLQVGIGSEPLPVLLALLLVLLLQGRFLCGLLGGNHAAHGVEHFALAFPVAAHEFIAAGLLLLGQLLALLLLLLVQCQLGRVLCGVMRLAPGDVVLPSRHVWLDRLRLARRYLLTLRRWLVFT